MPNSYQHLFFDLDHTLWDFEGNAHECLLEIYDDFKLKEIGVEDADAFFQKFSEANQYYWALLERKEITSDYIRKNRFKTALSKLGVEIDESLSLNMTQIFIQLLPHKKRLIEGATEILDYLKPHYQLHIISNGYHEMQMQKMKSAAIDHYFIEVITHEKANALKPEKAIFDYALNSTNAQFSNSLMIGDNYEADIKGAINAQFDTVFYNPAKQKTVEKPTFEIFQLTEMMHFL
jgi:YjjG family noncanonical pyrimidine nucleotidase